jgi:hypothetical protein
MTFRPRNLESLGSQIAVPILKDEDGYMGRECPSPDCLGYFKITLGTGLTGENLPCHCAYCGHVADQNQFFTQEQIEYAKSVALKKIADAIRKDLKGLEFNHPPKGPLGIGISLTLKEGRPIPIRHYREKRLETSVICDDCTLHYAIYGLFGFCPDCGAHNSLEILAKNLDLVLKQLELASTMDDQDFRRHLIEDALENCVSSFDGFGRETCRIRAQHSTNPGKADSISFQNPKRFAARLLDLFGIDIKSGVSPADWRAIHVGFMKRHVLSHRSGVVDAQYIAETSDSSAIIGRRVPLRAVEVRDLAGLLRPLGHSLVATLPTP